METERKNSVKINSDEYPYNMLTTYFLEGNQITSETEYEIEDINARKLILPERIDLMAKWFYIDAKMRNMDTRDAVKIYKKHIEAFSEGKYVEPGTEEKNSIEKYLKIFDDLIEDINRNGFNPEKSLVPVGKDNILLDGAHRSVCAAYFGQTIRIIRFPSVEKNYGTFFFKERLLEEDIIDQMVDQYCKLQHNVFFACLWPISDESLRDRAIQLLERDCGKIVYRRDILLEYNELRNFMIQIYGHQQWTGTTSDGHYGVNSKVDACYSKNSMTAVVFHCDYLEKVLTAKNKIRELFGIDNHSIHISDNDNETCFMSSLLFNANSRHLLKEGKIDFCEQLNKRVEELNKEKCLLENGIFIPDATMALYGLKDFKEIKNIYLTKDEEMLKTFGNNWRDYLYNPQHYLVFNNAKFVSLKDVKNIKSKDGNTENRKDIRKIREKLRKKTYVAEQYRKIIKWFERYRRNHPQKSKNVGGCIKEKIVTILRKMHIYSFMKKILCFKREE